MTKIELLVREAQQVPEPILDEVLDFLRFLKAKDADDASLAALASEAVLARDWLRPEEDQAWQGL